MPAACLTKRTAHAALLPATRVRISISPPVERQEGEQRQTGETQDKPACAGQKPPSRELLALFSQISGDSLIDTEFINVGIVYPLVFHISAFLDRAFLQL